MKWFTLKELTASATAVRRGIDNTPPSRWIIDNLVRLVDNILDPLREVYGGPVHISSGYRSGILNAAVGGSPRSQHLQGQAADLYADTLAGTRRLFLLIQSLGLPFDQLIWEGSWIHVSYGPRHRRQVIDRK